MKNLTPYNEANTREIEIMVGKAMCSYANWQDYIERAKEVAGGTAYENFATAAMGEYEATVRCIDMFVEQHLTYICEYVIERAKAELVA